MNIDLGYILINLTKKRYFRDSPPFFQHCGGERPALPRGSDTFGQYSLPTQSFSHEVPTSNNQDLLEGPCQKLLTGLDPVSDLIILRRNSFPHCQNLRRQASPSSAQISICHSVTSEQSWRRRSCRPSNRWINQLRRDNNNSHRMICGEDP